MFKFSESARPQNFKTQKLTSCSKNPQLKIWNHSRLWISENLFLDKNWNHLDKLTQTVGSSFRSTTLVCKNLFAKKNLYLKKDNKHNMSCFLTRLVWICGQLKSFRLKCILLHWLCNLKMTFIFFFFFFYFWSRNSEKKKQHICHIPGCNKVYGKTSHLRAHLR